MIIWDSRLLYPNLAHLLVFPCPSPLLHNCLSRRKQVPFGLSMYSWEMIKFLVASPSKENESFIACIPSRNYLLRRATGWPARGGTCSPMGGEISALQSTALSGCPPRQQSLRTSPKASGSGTNCLRPRGSYLGFIPCWGSSVDRSPSPAGSPMASGTAVVLRGGPIQKANISSSWAFTLAQSQGDPLAQW